MKLLSQISAGLTFALLLHSCNSNPAINGTKDQNKPNSTDSVSQNTNNIAEPLSIDKKLLNTYVAAYQNDTIAEEKIYFSKLLHIINEFNGKKLDTTLLTIGNIDDDTEKDTIFSRVYYNSNRIYVDSKWLKNNKVIWNYKYANPYLSFHSALLNYDTRSIWTIFAVGILYGTPAINTRQEFDEHADSSLQNYVYDYGVADLKKAGIKINKEDYKTYLKNFKGELLEFGEPETREGLFIYYKPAKRIITYYQP
jgi:hypothetical protein